MKLLVVTCLKEDQHIVSDLFEKAHIGVFSAAPAAGFRIGVLANHEDDQLEKDWDEFNSVVIFSFTTPEKASELLLMVKKHTYNSKPSYPVRAFVLPVENTSY